MQGLLQVGWRVSPLTSPRVWRHCDHCKERRPFDCSGKFRSNAQKKRLDVWLIYLCGHCGQTWNLPIHERRLIEDIGTDQFQAIAANDAALVQHYAFDVAHLRRYGDRVESVSDVAVNKLLQGGACEDARLLVIAITLAAPCVLRLERLLARELTLSRSRIRSLQQADILRLIPAGGAALKQAVRDQQRVSLRLGALAEQATDILRAACGQGDGVR